MESLQKQVMLKNQKNSKKLNQAKLFQISSICTHQFRDQLVESIEELIDLDDNYYRFQMRKNEHNSYISEINQQSQDTEKEIDMIYNLLISRGDQITIRIGSLIDNDELIEKTKKKQIFLKNKKIKLIDNKFKKDNDTIDAADDAIILVSPLLIKNIKPILKRKSLKQWNRVNQGSMCQHYFKQQLIIQQFVIYI